MIAPWHDEDDDIDLEPAEKDKPVAAPLRQMVFKDEAPGDTSDGFHTFDELYDHRRAFTAVLATMASIDGMSWRSLRHHPDDQPMFEGGWFIVGIDLPGGQISYHYKLDRWDDFAAVPEIDHAPKWDGHTPADVVDRLFEFAGLLGAAVAADRLEAGDAALNGAATPIDPDGDPYAEKI